MKLTDKHVRESEGQVSMAAVFTDNDIRKKKYKGARKASKSLCSKGDDNNPFTWLLSVF